MGQLEFATDRAKRLGPSPRKRALLEREGKKFVEQMSKVDWDMNHTYELTAKDKKSNTQPDRQKANIGNERWRAAHIWMNSLMW